MYDLLVVGGGPAALAATAYAVDKRLDVVMVYQDLGGKVGWRESLVKPADGGAATWQGGPHPLTTDQYLHANEHLRLLSERVMHAGCVIHDQVVRLAHRAAGYMAETQHRGSLQARTVLLATGARPRRLDVPGAELIDRAAGYSIATYAQFVAGQQVAVVGATPRAWVGTAELARLARHVYLIPHGDREPATPLSDALGAQPNIEVLGGWSVRSVVPSGTAKVLELGRGHERRTLEVQRVFVALGLEPNSVLVQQLANTDRHGFVVVDQAQATSLPGLFAAGDVATTGGEQVLIAIGDGVRAARNAHAFLMEQELLAGAAGDPPRHAQE